MRKQITKTWRSRRVWEQKKADSCNPRKPKSSNRNQLRCRKCRSTKLKFSQQVFADQSVHRRADCQKCGAFVKFLRQKKKRRRQPDGYWSELDREYQRIVKG